MGRSASEGGREGYCAHGSRGCLARIEGLNARERFLGRAMSPIKSPKTPPPNPSHQVHVPPRTQTPVLLTQTYHIEQESLCAIVKMKKIKCTLVRPRATAGLLSMFSNSWPTCPYQDSTYVLIKLIHVLMRATALLPGIGVDGPFNRNRLFSWCPMRIPDNT